MHKILNVFYSQKVAHLMLVGLLWILASMFSIDFIQNVVCDGHPCTTEACFFIDNEIDEDDDEDLLDIDMSYKLAISAPKALNGSYKTAMSVSKAKISENIIRGWLRRIGPDSNHCISDLYFCNTNCCGVCRMFDIHHFYFQISNYELLINKNIRNNINLWI